MTNFNTTTLETAALKSIFKNSDGGNGHDLDALENDNCSWFDATTLANNCGWAVDRAKGVISSLLSKRLIQDYGYDKYDCPLPFYRADKGFEALRELCIYTVEDC